MNPTVVVHPNPDGRAINTISGIQIVPATEETPERNPKTHCSSSVCSHKDWVSLCW